MAEDHLITMVEDLKIAEDKASKFNFVFNDGKKFVVSEHFYKLCPFLQKMGETFVSDAPVDVPFKDYDSKSYKIILELFYLIKTQDSKSYAMALKGENCEIQPSASLKSFFDELRDDDRINAANFGTGFLSMDFIKRYFVWYYSLLNNSTPTTENEKVKKAFGTTSLDKNDMEDHDLLTEESLWKTYGWIYEDLMGKPFNG